MPTCMIGVTVCDIPVSGGTAFPDVGARMFYVISPRKGVAVGA